MHSDDHHVLRLPAADFRHSARLILTCLSSLVFLLSLSPDFAIAGPPPNIVFIIADDLGISDLSCYGRADQPTPHIDAIAAAGLRFTAAYAAQSICSPTRAAIMTGRAPARLHLTTFLSGRPDSPAQLLLQAEIPQQLPLAEITIAEMLKPAGYVSACIGKWHLGDKGFLPTDQGFDHYFPGKANTPPSAAEGGKGEYELTAEGEKFMEINRERPFFLYIAHNCPHVPLSARAELIEKHQGAFNPVYAAMIETLDDCVGRIAAKIDALGLSQNTLFVFTSDNGGLSVLEGAKAPATHNRPFRAGKGFCYEGGLRIPLVVRWPGKIRDGSTTDVPIMSTDWLPTLAALTGTSAPAQLDGVAFDRLLSENQPPAPRALHWHLPHYTNQGGRPSGAIRDGDWKLIEHYEDGHCELFNLTADHGESKDLSAQEPSRVADLRGKLETWRRAVSAQESQANPNFNPAAWQEIYRDSIDVSRLSSTADAPELARAMASWRQRMDDAVPRPRRDIPAVVQPGAGAMILRARDAKLHGDQLRYEDDPRSDAIGSWTVGGDWLEWEFESRLGGKFHVELLEACDSGSEGARIEISAAGQTLITTVAETGHSQRFVPRDVGIVNLAGPGHFTLSARALSKPGKTVMNLRRVTLRAASNP